MLPEHHQQHHDVERAQYQAFTRTWAAAVRQSGTDPIEMQQRLLRYFRRLCRRIDPTVVLEIGAHEASFSQWAASEFPGARVVAFEANPHVHAKFAPTLAETRVDYRNVAVGPVNADVDLNVPLEVRGKPRKLTNKMASLAVHTLATDYVQVTVPGVRLDDDLALGPDDRVVAWIDVEGANEVVLQSGPSVLDRTDAIYIEVEWEPTWEGQWLDDDVALHLRRHGLVPVARDVQRHKQYNVVFVRAELVEDLATTRGAARVLTPQEGGDPE